MQVYKYSSLKKMRDYLVLFNGFQVVPTCTNRKVIPVASGNNKWPLVVLEAAFIKLLFCLQRFMQMLFMDK